MLKDTQHTAISDRSKNSLEAGVAGAGGGTLFVLIAESLPEAWSIKPALVYLAPAFSVVCSAFWLWTLKVHKAYRRNKKLGIVLRQLEVYINNPMTSMTHRNRLIKRMEEIQISVLSRTMKEVEAMFDKEDS
jgi:hypothetical protein